MSLLACADHDLVDTLSKDYFVFGRYYGYCAGDCLDVFALSNEILYKAEGESYPTQNSPWNLPDMLSLDDDKKELVSELPGLVPQVLLNTEEHVIGCPDCSDFGAVYIEMNHNGEKKFWYIDNATQDIDLKNFIGTVHTKVNLLTGK